MLEVDGDSMIDAHIEKGDMVLVEKRAISQRRRDSDCRSGWGIYDEIF